jgi:hypothetical protein
MRVFISVRLMGTCATVSSGEITSEKSIILGGIFFFSAAHV